MIREDRVAIAALVARNERELERVRGELRSEAEARDALRGELLDALGASPREGARGGARRAARAQASAAERLARPRAEPADGLRGLALLSRRGADPERPKRAEHAAAFGIRRAETAVPLAATTFGAFSGPSPASPGPQRPLLLLPSSCGLSAARAVKIFLGVIL